MLAIAALYAYRAQSSGVRDVSSSEALSRIERGEVSSVTIRGNAATLAIARDGVERVQTTTQDGGAEIARAVAERNRADPAHPVSLRYEQESPAVGPAVAVLVGLLPLLVLIALVLLLARAFGRTRRTNRYDQLARLADLRDRSAITEEEFQREKARIFH
jgi:ATP-dependent Zn protease